VTGAQIMSVNGRYDGDLQMLVEEPRDANREHLLFLRWLAERDRLEHTVAGPPHMSPTEQHGCRPVYSTTLQETCAFEG
jgi:hypothetical protein